MILIVLRYVTQSANLLNVTHHARNPKMQFVTSNVRNQNAKLSALIKDVKCSTVLNVLLSVKLHIVLLIVKHPSLSVKLYVKNQNVIGNVINPTALNQNVNWFVKIPTVLLKLNVVLALWEVLESHHLYLSSRKLNLTKNAALAIKTNVRF